MSGCDGLLVVGHGTRDPTGVQQFLSTVADIRLRMRPLLVEGAFLELAQPSIADGVARLLDRGVRQVIVLPFLLFAAKHVKEDIPAAVHEAVRELRPHDTSVSVRQLPHLNHHPGILELSAWRFQQIMGSHSRTPEQLERTELVIVARGTGDVGALREVEEFAQQRVLATPVAHWRLCYLAVARPSLEEGLAAAAAGGLPRIVIQPHLLFSGQLWDRLADRLVEAAQQWPQQQWQLTQTLGPDPRLADLAVASVLP